MASATITAVDFTDDEQIYSVDVLRNNGALIQSITCRYPIFFDPADVQAQISASSQQVVERARARNQRKQLPVGTVINLG